MAGAEWVTRAVTRPASVDHPAVPDEVSVVACQVWLADLDLLRPGHLALLSPLEHERRQRYAMAEDRARFALGVALMRLAVGRETGLRPGDVRIDRRCDRCPESHGKPRLPGAGLHASVSHSGERVALALTRTAPIGVDVEKMTGRDVRELARGLVAEDELIQRPRDFYTYWCRKEAVVKATGDGLRAPLVEVRVGPATGRPRLLAYPGSMPECTLQDMAVGPGFAAAVAVLAAGRLVVEYADPAALLAGAEG
ncbi:4'-phosphopantetheinyl transferase family protein [Micromonosporaceae bacterium Da 78-11]